MIGEGAAHSLVKVYARVIRFDSRYLVSMKRLILFAVVTIAVAIASGPIAMAAQDDPRLDALFERLRTATSEQEISATELAIWSIWSESGDEAVDKLMRRGSAAMMIGDYESALVTFNTIIELKPDFAEGWNKRATLYYLMGRYEESIKDVERTLALEPRHFGALSGLGLIQMELENYKEALEAFEAALAVHPHLSNAKRYIEELKPLVYGREI